MNRVTNSFSRLFLHIELVYFHTEKNSSLNFTELFKNIVDTGISGTKLKKISTTFYDKMLKFK